MIHSGSPKLSIVIPLYRSEESIPELVERLISSLSAKISFEIIFVDDGSPDQSWDIVSNLSESTPEIRGIRLSRNFGQHNAISAGIDAATGHFVAVMDADLQDAPEDLPPMFDSLVNSNAFAVIARRAKRVDSIAKKMGSKLFWHLYKLLTGVNVDSNIGNFGIYSREIIDSVLLMNEQHRAFGLFVAWTGFPIIYFDVERSPRAYGKSSYSLRKLLNLGASGIISYSDRLLKINALVGIVLAFLALIAGIGEIIAWFFFSAVTPGWTSLIVVMLFSTGLILTGLGILGIYVSQVFEESKKRPIYLVRDEINKP